MNESDRLLTIEIHRNIRRGTCIETSDPMVNYLELNIKLYTLQASARILAESSAETMPHLNKGAPHDAVLGDRHREQRLHVRQWGLIY